MKQYNLTQNLGLIVSVATLGLATLPVSTLGQHAHEGSGAKKPSPKTVPSKDATPGTLWAMPRIQEKGVMTVKGDEKWDEITGFGKESSMTEMMTQMMVGGSGMEHMRMAVITQRVPAGMKINGMAKGGTDQAQGMPVTVTLAQNPPAVGENTLDVLVTDPGGKPLTGLKLMATVAMTSMDMGTERPKAIEGKDGHYSVPVKFSMKGPWRIMLMNDGKADKNSAVHTTLDFNVDGKTKWMQPKSAGGMKKTSGDHGDMKGMEMPGNGGQSGDYKITVSSDPKTFKVGKNTLDVMILDASGKPVMGAKVTGAVEMTSMDMGVTKPKAQEGKGGHYTVPIEFSMKGPWRVTLTVAPPKQKPFTKALDFQVAP